MLLLGKKLIVEDTKLIDVLASSMALIIIEKKKNTY
jgi:hypothetical protein